jgi:hypothetical protein
MPYPPVTDGTPRSAWSKSTDFSSLDRPGVAVLGATITANRYNDKSDEENFGVSHDYTTCKVDIVIRSSLMPVWA